MEKDATRHRLGRYQGALFATTAVVLLGSGGVAWARAKVGVDNVSKAVTQPSAPRPIVPPTRTYPPPTVAAKPTVKAITPASGKTGVPTGSSITVTLSAPPAMGAPMPTLVPPVSGAWYVSGATLTFKPSAGLAPWGTQRVIVPAALAHPATSHFGVAGVPVLRVQQVLAELGYLPVSFGTDQALYDTEPAQTSLVPSMPQAGSFWWAYPNVPKPLAALWHVGQDSVMTVGAVMHFEAVEDLNIDGVVGPQVWHALAAAVAARDSDPVPYDYLMTSETLPEKLVVWQDGAYVFETLVNTGVYGATTQTGTFPVYLRFEATTMKGTDPDGTKYDIAGVPWVAYFNGGDAVHGFWRYSYGYPQSNGCVELPVDNAEVVWGLDPIGTLVTVRTSPLPVGS